MFRKWMRSLKCIYLTALLINKIRVTRGWWYMNERVLDCKSGNNRGVKNSKVTAFNPFSKSFQLRTKNEYSIWNVFSLAISDYGQNPKIKQYNNKQSKYFDYRMLLFWRKSWYFSQHYFHKHTEFLKLFSLPLSDKREGQQILDTRWPSCLNCMWWLLVCAGPQFGTLFQVTSPTPRIFRWS